MRRPAIALTPAAPALVAALSMAALATAVAACFSPVLEGIQCASEDSSCPDGLACDFLTDTCVTAGTAICAEPCASERLSEIRLATGVDLLFVIDNSGTMQDEQALLAANFANFIAALEAFDGGLPDVHIGVVSTDVGTGPFAIAFCAGDGDDGRLQATPRGQCEAPSGSFIVDVSDGAGGRVRNYDPQTPLAEVFSCIAQLGIDGCGFEQPLEAMRRALDGRNSENAGFLRDEAVLAVVIVGDEDDCSVTDRRMFDPSQTDINSELGPISSFRCFEFGVQCDPDEPRETGDKAACQSRADSPFMVDVREYVDFLLSIKGANNLVSVAAITGPPDPVTVALNPDGNPELAASCVAGPAGDEQSAVPSVRLTELVGAFGQRGVTRSICSADFSPALAALGDTIASGLESAVCLTANLVDVDAATPGVQPRCTVTDSTDAAVPVCSNLNDPGGSDQLPCFLLGQNDIQCPNGPRLQLAVFGLEDAAPGLSVAVDCVTAQAGDDQ